MYISVKKASEILGISIQSVRAKCVAGKIPAKKLWNGKWLINFDKLKTILP